MGKKSPNRRSVLKSLTATGLAGLLPVTGRARAGDGNQTATSATTPASSDSEVNELDYQLDYGVDRFDGDNVSVSGTVRYEKKKYAADSSFYTWQGGTWVNAADDSSQQNGLTTDFWVPGTKNSRVIIEESGSTEVELRLPIVAAYADRPDDQGEEYPSEWVQYAFDTAWDLISSKAPFYVPPRPPGVEQDSERTDVVSHSISGPSAELEFYDPVPPLSSGYDVTHSADWKWEVAYGVEPGWNYVHADRQVDVGEWYLGTTNSFGSETQHQIALVSAFCIYQDDYTACEVDGCSGCIQSTTTDTSSEPLRDCCQLERVERPIPVADELLTAAASRARDDAGVTDREPETEFDVQATDSFQAAREMNDPLRELVAYRSAAAHARGSDSRAAAADGKASARDVTQLADRVDRAVDDAHERLSYAGESLDEALGRAGQIEKKLLSARSWVESGRQATDQEYMGESEVVKYGTSALEFAEGNLADAAFYRRSVADELRTATDRGAEVAAVRDDLEATVQSRLADAADGTDPHVEYVVENAESYLDRAAQRDADGFTAAAVVDLLYALAYANAATAVVESNFEDVDADSLEVQQELTADRFNGAAADASGDVHRLLLQFASLEYNSGVESFGTYRDRGDDYERKRAHVHFLAVESMLDVSERVYEEFLDA